MIILSQWLYLVLGQINTVLVKLCVHFESRLVPRHCNDSILKHQPYKLRYLCELSEYQGHVPILEFQI